MEQENFERLITSLCCTANLPEALEMLQTCQIEEIEQEAKALVGQFSLAAVQGKSRIYHVFIEENDQGVEEEFVEHVMYLDEPVIVFVAWFFYTQFGIKNRDTYAAAGKTYKQPKREK